MYVCLNPLNQVLVSYKTAYLENALKGLGLNPLNQVLVSYTSRGCPT